MKPGDRRKPGRKPGDGNLGNLGKPGDRRNVPRFFRANMGISDPGNLSPSDPPPGFSDTFPSWPAGCPSIRTKAVSSTKVSCRCFSTVFFAAREVEDQDSGNLTLNHLRWRSFHQPSIRPKPRP